MKIERAANARGKCRICGDPIATGKVRTVVWEGLGGERYRSDHCHLDCAVELKPQLAHDCLIARDSDPELVVAVLPEVEKLDPALAAKVRTVIAQRPPTRVSPVLRQALPLLGERTLALVRQLEDAPEDRAILAVLADVLQQAGDPRGELIVLELGDMDPQRSERRRELVAALSPELAIANGCRWGIGFIRRLALSVEGTSLCEYASLFEHPSCALLTELVVRNRPGAPIEIPPGVLPKTLRWLAVERVLTGSLDGLASLPRLEHLSFGRCDAVAHPNVRSLELVEPDAKTLEVVRPDALPRLTRLVISQPTQRAFTWLLRSGWLARITELGLQRGRLGEADLIRLERALGGRRLDSLDLSETPVPKTWVPILQRITKHLVDVDLDANISVLGHWVEHTGKPEWGRGKVVREYDGKLEIAFASGTRTLKADAPFLRLRRS